MYYLPRLLLIGILGSVSSAQQTYLKASNTDAYDRLGSAVSISGDTLVVGAYEEDSNATGVNGDQSDNSAWNAGAAYVLVRSGTTWIQQAYLKPSNTDADDYFGWSVSISDDTMVVGAPYEDSNARGVNGDQANNTASRAGAAYVFVRSGSTWTQQAYLKASNTDAGDVFGQSVSVSGDTVVIGALGEASAATGVNGNQFDNSAFVAGAAYVFVRSGSTWSQQAYLKASNTEASDSFGVSVAISGGTLVVGAEGEDSEGVGVNGNQTSNWYTDSGAAYVFVNNGTTWTQDAYLKASNTDLWDNFGNSVTISGDTLVVGARGEGYFDDESGAAYVFARSGSSWGQQALLKASNMDAYDHFGSAVSISGDTIVVAARRERSNARGVNGDQSNNSAGAAGAVYEFVLRGRGGWTQSAYLKASNTDAGDAFGVSVAASAGTTVVGAYFERSNARGVNGDQSNNSASGAGAAYVFRLPRASSRTVGSGCIATGFGNAPELLVDVPLHGSTSQLKVTSRWTPDAVGVILLGAPHSGIPLGATCTAYFDITLPTIPMWFKTNWYGTWLSPRITIGNDPSVTGVEIALQAGLDNLPTAPLGMALSNGVWVKIGY